MSEYEVERAAEHMQKAYDKAVTLPLGLRMLIWREKCHIENVLWYVKKALKKIQHFPLLGNVVSIPVLSRSYIADLIYDEEKATVDYEALAENPVIKQNEAVRSTVLGIAEDERRHAQHLNDILELFEREGKIV